MSPEANIRLAEQTALLKQKQGQQTLSLYYSMMSCDIRDGVKQLKPQLAALLGDLAEACNQTYAGMHCSKLLLPLVQCVGMHVCCNNLRIARGPFCSQCICHSSAHVLHVPLCISQTDYVSLQFAYQCFEPNACVVCWSNITVTVLRKHLHLTWKLVCSCR